MQKLISKALTLMKLENFDYGFFESIIIIRISSLLIYIF